MKHCTKLTSMPKPSKEYSQSTLSYKGKKGSGFSGRPKGYETKEG